MTGDQSVAMRPGDAIGLGIITAFWVGADIYLLLHPYVADGLGSYIGVSGEGLEWLVFILGTIICVGVGWYVEQYGDD